MANNLIDEAINWLDSHENLTTEELNFKLAQLSESLKPVLRLMQPVNQTKNEL